MTGILSYKLNKRAPITPLGRWIGNGVIITMQLLGLASVALVGWYVWGWIRPLFVVAGLL